MKLTLKHSKRAIVALFMAICLVVLAYAVFATYGAYTQTVIEQRQQHLLIIARAVSQNLDLYLSEQLRNVGIVVSTPGFTREFDAYYQNGRDKGLKEYLASYMLSQHQGLSRIYLLDREGNIIFEYNQYPFIESFNESVLNFTTLSDENQSGIGSVFPLGPNRWGMTITSNVYSGQGFLGAVVGVVDLQELYDQLVAPLSARDEGAIVVKDETGTILMHATREMIGLNHLRDVEGLYENSDFSSLNAMLQKQLKYEEGTATYLSWDNGILPSQPKIAAFSRMNLGGRSWLISAEMPYEEAILPVNQNLGQFALLVAAILVLLLCGLFVIYNLQKKRQKLQMETRYLRDINYTLEELHQSREQVRHYEKLHTIGALAGGIAHEFNNLLTPIMGYSEFLKEQLGTDSDYFEDVDEIYKAGARAKEIVEQILPFSRRESDTSAYGPVSLDAVLRDIVKMVRMILPSSIRLEEDFETGGINIWGSATQLHQVLLNLCSNAYQAMGENGGVLTISSKRISHANLPGKFRGALGDYAQLVISDTGCGMSEEMIHHIFDPFFTTKEVGEGTGLGLSVVQNIITTHEGFIDVTSIPGRGSSFWVYLPITDQPVGERPITHAPESKTAETLTLMLVDDDPKVLAYLKKRLMRKGYEVEAFTDAQEALDAFYHTADHWDVVIADYTMPKYKGTTLARKIKKSRPDLPVLLITGLVEKEALQMQQSGVLDGILIKPLDFDELLETIIALEK